MSEPHVIIPRRNFLIRALGFTAAGATMAIPIVTVANAKARIDHHKAELEKAIGDYYAGFNVKVIDKCCAPEQLHTSGVFFLAVPPGSPYRRANAVKAGAAQTAAEHELHFRSGPGGFIIDGAGGD
jgi:hypothetical protein